MNKDDLTLKQLRAFIAVAQEGNLGRAAEKLFITKPAVSVALQQFELKLGEPVFDRVNNRLRLNARGRQALPLALELQQRARDLATLFSHEGGKVAIGSSQTIGNSLIAPLLVKYGDVVSPQLVISNSGELIDKLEAFELDLAFIEADILRPWLQRESWRTDTMQVVCAPDHPLATKRGLCPRDLAAYPWILREPASGTRRQFDERLAADLADYTVALEINSNESIVSAVALNLGLSFLSNVTTATAVAAGRLNVVDMQMDYQRQLYLVYHRDKYQSPSMKAFIECCRELS